MNESLPECIVCRIAAGAAPASVVYEDAWTLAFLDIRPVNPGHTLVIPKQHAANLAELDEPTGGRLFQVAMRLAAALRASGLRCEGVNLFLADGEAAFQEVFHVHLHVLPRFAGDSFKIAADWSQTPARPALESQAAALRQSYARLYSAAPGAPLAHKLAQTRLLIARLEKMSADSHWARRASGTRGALLRWADELQAAAQAGQTLTSEQQHALAAALAAGYDFLERSAREYFRPRRGAA